MPTPLHNHTEYSTLDGLSRPWEIADACKKHGFEAAACTDHGVVAGHIAFHKEMTKAGLHPILGMEAYQAKDNRRLQEKGDDHHLVLLAKNDVGLRNLWRISTEAHRSGFYYKPRVDWDLLSEFSEGVICTSACMGGLLAQTILGNVEGDVEQTLLRYRQIFGDDFYLEIHTYPGREQEIVNSELRYLSSKWGIRPVYANDAHYAFPEQWSLHETILALNTGKKLSDPPMHELNPEDRKHGRMSHEPVLYIMSEAEVRQALSYLSNSFVSAAIETTDEIAASTGVTLPERRNRVPRFTPEKGYQTNREMLRSLVLKGYEKKILGYGKEGESQPYWQRLIHEMKVIEGVETANLVDYFLIVRDAVYWAKQNGIMVGPGRGSVGGSLVAYLIGITEVDPLRYGLIFERFYNAGRETSMPDIDIDYEPVGREKVIEYVSKKYGPEKVAHIGTVTKMGPKLSIKDLGRALGLPFKDVEAINKILDETIDAGLLADWEEIWPMVGERLEPYRKRFANMLIKSGEQPCSTCGDDVVEACSECEGTGTVPMVVHEADLFAWAEALHEYVRTYGIHASAVIIADEPLDEAFPLRWAAGQKKLVSQWDMHVADDFGYLKKDFLGLRNLTTLTEVNRILCERGDEPIDYEAIQYQEHPEEMWQLLDKGLTVGLFQVEDGGTARQIAKAMRCRSVDDLAILNAMNRPGPLRSGAFDKFMIGRNGGTVIYDHSILEPILKETFGVFLYQEQVIRYMVAIGYTLQEADDVRAIMGKKKVEKLEEEFPRYMSHATRFMSDELAAKIWRDLTNFAKYGFNKSHAVEYGIILLWCLYAKFHYPKEFVLAGIRTVDKADQSRWVNEAQRMGIVVRSPDINDSGTQSMLVRGEILLGLTNIKGMGQSHARWIVENRPYESFDQFEEMTRRDDLKYTLPNGTRKVVVDSRRVGLLYDAGAFDVLEGRRRQISQSDRIALEEELLGVALSDESAKVLDKHASLVDRCDSYDAIYEPGEYVLAGIVKEVRERKTKKGDPFAFVKIAQDADECEFAVWQDKLARYEFLLKPRTPIIAEIKKSDRGAHLVQARVLT